MNAKLWKVFGLFVIVVLIASAMNVAPAYAAPATSAAGIRVSDANCTIVHVVWQNPTQTTSPLTVYIDGVTPVLVYWDRTTPGGLSHWYGSYPELTSGNHTVGGGDANNSVNVSGCHGNPPEPKYASVSVNAPSGCVQDGTLVSVSFSVSHATLTLDGVGYNSNGSVNLGAGTHSWSAVADNGYTMQGNASGSFTIETCPAPKYASAGVDVPTGCVNQGETMTVGVSADHATLTLDGVGYNSNGSVNLGAGLHSWTASPDSGYSLIGDSSGSFTIASCPPPPEPKYATASVSVPEGCITDGSAKPVSFSVSHATLTLDGVGYNSNGSVNLGAGLHSWTAVADADYTLQGNASGSFTITVCETPDPQYASASVSAPSGCVADGQTTPISFSVSHATLTLDGVGYNSNGSVNLGAGTHSWSAVADNGYTMQGNASGSFTITVCEEPLIPGQARVTVSPLCQNGTEHGISADIVGATLTINNGSYSQGGFIALQPGTYGYTWTATPNYTGNGEGTIVVPADCNAVPQIARHLWRPTCKNDCKAGRWETEAGPVSWKSNDLLGKGKPGILWATVNVNCDPSNGHGCNYRTMVYGTSSLTGFTVISRGVKYHSFQNVGADGMVYNMFIGFTDTCWKKAWTGSGTDDCAAGKPNITLPNGWVAVNMPQDYYQVIPDVQAPVYWEWPCSLSPSYAWTTADGKAINFPGTNSNDWIVFVMKAGVRPWPKTWPDHAQLGWWVWLWEPMKTTRAWATSLLHLHAWDTLTLPAK